MNLKDFLEYMNTIPYGEGEAYPSKDTIETAKSLYNVLIENGYNVQVSGNGENELGLYLRKGKKLFDFLITDKNISYCYGISGELSHAVGEDDTTKTNTELLELVKNHFQDR